MKELVKMRETCKEFYGQFYGVINIVLKFLLAMAMLLFINHKIGYSSVFTNIFIILIMALIASIMKLTAMLYVGAVAIVGNMFAVGTEIGLLATVLFIVMIVLFIWFVPDDSPAAVFTPMALACGIPAVVPICYGLKRNPASLAAICPGVIVYYFMEAVSANAELIMAEEKTEYLARVKLLIEGVSENSMFAVTLLAMAAVLVLVYIIRKSGKKNSFMGALIAGIVVYGVIQIGGVLALGIQANLLAILIGLAGAFLIALVFLFFIYHVDYSRTEEITFEDDEFYYYVKAIPKVMSGAVRREKLLHGDEVEEEPEEEPEEQEKEPEADIEYTYMEEGQIPEDDDEYEYVVVEGDVLPMEDDEYEYEYIEEEAPEAEEAAEGTITPEDGDTEYEYVEVPEGEEIPEGEDAEYEYVEVPEGEEIPEDEDVEYEYVEVPEGEEIPEGEDVEYEYVEVPEGEEIPEGENVEYEYVEVPEGEEIPEGEDVEYEYVYEDEIPEGEEGVEYEYIYEEVPEGEVIPKGEETVEYEYVEIPEGEELPMEDDEYEYEYVYEDEIAEEDSKKKNKKL